MVLKISAKIFEIPRPREMKGGVRNTKTKTKTFNTMAKSGRASVKKKTEARWQKESASVERHSHCETKGAEGGEIKKLKDK